jgi:hypothetical protein
MTWVDASTSTMIKRVWQGLLILVFVVSIWGINALTTYYVRSPSPAVYAFSGGSGELWLTLLALSALEAFLIVSFEEQKKNGQVGDQRESPP